MARARRLSTRILLGQLAIMLAAMLLGFVLYVLAVRDQLDRQYQQRALAIAQTVTANHTIGAAVEYHEGGAIVQGLAEEVREATGASYVVVIDGHGVRLSHPNPALIGKRIEEPVVALDGRTHVGIDNGSLGRSANGKAPLRGPSGAIVGEVSAGIVEGAISDQLFRELPTMLVYLGIALALGLTASLLLTSRLRRATYGVELDEIGGLLREREAMLHGIREGVITMSPDGRVTLVNDEASRLLGIPPGAVGKPLAELLPPGPLRRLLSSAQTVVDETVVADEHVLVVSRVPVERDGRQLGAVVTMRDRTEHEGLVRELRSVRALTQALRAQEHQFANRIHTLAGLLHMGAVEEAAAYASELTGAEAGAAESLRSSIASPLVVALLLAKRTVAGEHGVRLEVSEDSELVGPLGDVEALLTVLGNLIDNAVDAASDGQEPRWVSVYLSSAGSGITVRVADSGPGVPDDALDTIFTDGYSTKSRSASGERGLGLPIVHRLVQRRGGRVSVQNAPGAVFTVVLPAAAASVAEPTT